eukprot:357678-Chlamydomonas_euryale.AAC.3
MATDSPPTAYAERAGPHLRRNVAVPVNPPSTQHVWKEQVHTFVETSRYPSKPGPKCSVNASAYANGHSPDSVARERRRTAACAGRHVGVGRGQV